MTEIALPLAYAIFVWWFSTGVILYLDGLNPKTFRVTMTVATFVLVLALWGGFASADDATLAGAFCGFTTGLLAWGWIELSFLTGWITGPWKQPCPDGARGWTRVKFAILAILWHEIAIALMAVLLAFVTLGHANETAFWTFAILWIMRTSAKLNVFLGVRNLAEEFLPEHLRYLETFFQRRPMNLLLPVSVSVAGTVTVLLVDAALDPAASPHQAASLMLLGTLLGLAVLEHWLLVLPLPATALWTWGLRSHLARELTDELAPGMKRVSVALDTPCDAQDLAGVLQAVAGGAYGQDARLRGVARTGAGWVCFYVAGGRTQLARLKPRADETARVVALGREIDPERLAAAFAACMTPSAKGVPA